MVGVTGLLWLCGFLACGFVTVVKNHIARDYHTVMALPAVHEEMDKNGGNLKKVLLKSSYNDKSTIKVS